MKRVKGHAVIHLETGNLHAAYRTYAGALGAIHSMPWDSRSDFDVVACEIEF